MGRLEIFGIEGIPQIGRGDDLAGLIADAVARGAASEPAHALRDGEARRVHRPHRHVVRDRALLQRGVVDEPLVQ